MPFCRTSDMGVDLMLIKRSCSSLSVSVYRTYIERHRRVGVQRSYACTRTTYVLAQTPFLVVCLLYEHVEEDGLAGVEVARDRDVANHLWMISESHQESTKEAHRERERERERDGHVVVSNEQLGEPEPRVRRRHVLLAKGRGGYVVLHVVHLVRDGRDDRLGQRLCVLVLDQGLGTRIDLRRTRKVLFVLVQYDGRAGMIEVVC